METSSVDSVEISPSTTHTTATADNVDANPITTATKPVPPAPAPAPVFQLLQLAPELRQKIFEWFFSSSRFAVHCGLNCEGDCRNASAYDDEDEDEDDAFVSRLAITKVSKLIRHESIAAMLRVSRFDFQLLDNHTNWTPNPLLKEHISRMKHLYGPPRLLHYIGLTTLPWCTTPGTTVADSRWLEKCTAEHIVCDMIIDAFDIQDAVADPTCSEGQYFQGLKDAIAGTRGARLTLCIQLEDSVPTWNAWDEAHIRTGFQIYKRKVIVRRKPRTEVGKVNLETTLSLLGVELETKDQHIIEPAKKEGTQTETVQLPAQAMDVIMADTDAEIFGTAGVDGGATENGADATTLEDDNQATNDTAPSTATEPNPAMYDSALEWWNGEEDY